MGMPHRNDSRVPIKLYSWPTTNGRRVHIMLEELGWPYRAHAVNLELGEQRSPAYTAINPNAKIPSIVDPSGPSGAPITVFESGAILLYLAERAGRFLSADPQVRHETLCWFMFQISSVGPALGVAHHYRYYAPETLPYAIARSTKEARRLYGVMDTQLQRTPWMCGNEYTIADIAAFPWLQRSERQGIDWGEFGALRDWYLRVGQRPAVQRGLGVLGDCLNLMPVPSSPPAPTSAPAPSPSHEYRTLSNHKPARP